MSRQRKNHDILAQLGEPLPLPYRTTPDPVKAEHYDEPNAIPSVSTEPLRRRRVLSGRNSAPESAETHIPLPIWRSERLSEEIRSLEESVRVETTVFDALLAKIEEVKAAVGPESLDHDDQARLENMLTTLEDIHKKRQSQNIVRELEKIQLSGTSRPTSTKIGAKGGLAALVLVLLLASFVAGQFSYEYCYYFC